MPKAKNKKKVKNMPDYDTKALIEKVGFYYAVFQRTLSGDYIKCWLDGSENYELYSREEMISFCNANGVDYEVECKLRESFDETSLFLWDVSNRDIRRLSAMGDSNSEKFNLSKINSRNSQKDIELNKFGAYNNYDGNIKIFQ